jgi:hypothetical protein
MSRVLHTLLVMIILTGSGVPAVLAQDEQMQMPPMGPPEEVKKLAFLEGEWAVAVKHRMAPEGPWEESSATVTVQPILGGAAYQSSFDATMMGMPFEGIGIDSYNRELGQYESYWIDSMGAKSSMMTGNFEGEKLVMQGEDMMMGQKMWNRATSIKKSADEVHWSMETSTDGGETWYESMQMVYTRKK